VPTLLSEIERVVCLAALTVLLAALQRVRAEAFDDAARIARPSPMERSRMPQSTVIELESLARTFTAGAAQVRQGRDPLRAPSLDAHRPARGLLQRAAERAEVEARAHKTPSDPGVPAPGSRP
jgi:cob(I)alamin adenosyltransferase